MRCRALLRVVGAASGLVVALAMTTSGYADGPQNWPQWGQNPQHQGFVDSVGQSAQSILANLVYDPFVPQEQADQGGSLLAHYQVPLIHANSVYMMFKTGTWTPSGSPTHWNSQIWNEKKLHWQDGRLLEQWNFQSDWKPEPSNLAQWEPVFHPVLANEAIYVPGFGGSVFKLDAEDGTNLGRINPFGTLDPNTFVAGPLSMDGHGNVFYNALKLDANNGLVDSWLVKISGEDGNAVSMVSYSTLLAPVNPPTTCFSRFTVATLPWPPSPTAQPAMVPCGGQRPGLNIAPAFAPDGTIYTASRGHNPRGDRYAYLVAVNPDLTLKWAASLRDRLNDGCGVLVPKATMDNPIQKGKCRFDANTGVDPETNQQPAGRILDAGTASPTVLPDGSIIFGAYTRYNIARGHTMKFSSSGQFLAAYDFGWDDTEAVFQHDGTFSIVMKDNHYDEEAGFYCNTDDNPVSQGGDPNHIPNVVCDFTGVPAGPFYITQVNPNLVPEWKFQSTNTQSCTRNPDGSLSCVSDHPHGFEWCINAPAIDGNGTVYVESEDGAMYVLRQGHHGVFTTPSQTLFLNLALGAAYTPLSIAPDGKLYTQNDGHLFVIGVGGQEGGDNGDHSAARGLRQLPD